MINNLSPTVLQMELVALLLIALALLIGISINRKDG